MRRSLIGGMLYAGGAESDECRINKRVGGPESTRDLRVIYRESVGCQRVVRESQDLKERMH